MTDMQQVPEPAHSPTVSRVKCDFVVGDQRYVARLAVRETPVGPKAIWRNEVGPAEVTGPRARS